ncbi:hypothetical protein, variant [Spizellomyces punctatus DAOM BR117]|nr:hypothetical protein, variant [Spizellomyces punctatus DAOM BR117]KNC96497.1 hypothetical protein, variant [Spizellomyces punctatus DAOM BR117]|eukprot:XP_016604537.1 hypothetical protein, variant [Spizellomyces punctatus DAOM BR117]
MQTKIPPYVYERLMDFQKVGVLEAIKKQGKVLLGDEMGLGKTIQAIAICAFYRSEWPVMVICPSSLRLTWQAEICKWLDLPEERIQVIFASKDRVSSESHFVITSYDLASREDIKKQLEKAKYRIVVADESHFLKSREAKRTKTIIPLLKGAKRALLLSGTPALSRPIELFTQISALLPSFTTAVQFGVRYCDGKQNRYGWDFTGNSNIAELHWFLEQTVLIRRLKKDVLKELPSKTRQCVYVDIAAKSKQTFAALMAQNEEINERLEDAKTASNTKHRQEVTLEKRTLLIQMYRETGIAKLPAVQEYLRELHDHTSKKFIVFAHHTHVLDTVSEQLNQLKTRYVRIDGSTSSQVRQDLCEEFQNDPETRVAVLSITAAGVGLTLHAADLVVFAELFWNPAQLLQGEDRAHRIGREENVDIKYILARGTLDDIQWPLIRRKLDVVGQSIDGHSATMDTIESSSARDEKEKRLQPTIDKFFGSDETLTELIGGSTEMVEQEKEAHDKGRHSVKTLIEAVPTFTAVEGSSDYDASQSDDERNPSRRLKRKHIDQKDAYEESEQKPKRFHRGKV